MRESESEVSTISDATMEYPIDEVYPAIYRDDRGEERTVIRNDGQRLWMTVRGVTFADVSPDGFEPIEGTDSDALTAFTFNRNELCGCEIEYDVPQPMVDRGQPANATLHVRLKLGLPAERGWLDHVTLILSLSYNGETYSGTGKSGWFEDELLEIQAVLPEGVYLKTCTHCAYSDYSPYGHGLFGGMACFRDNKAEYLKISGKHGIFRIWDTHTENVQETYHCPEFERRIPGSGYRG